MVKSKFLLVLLFPLQGWVSILFSVTYQVDLPPVHDQVLHTADLEATAAAHLSAVDNNTQPRSPTIYLLHGEHDMDDLLWHARSNNQLNIQRLDLPRRGNARIIRYSDPRLIWVCSWRFQKLSDTTSGLQHISPVPPFNKVSMPSFPLLHSRCRKICPEPLDFSHVTYPFPTESCSLISV